MIIQLLLQLLIRPNCHMAVLTVKGIIMVTIFQALGFSVNTDKSLLTPQQEIEFLRVIIQSHPPAFHLPQHKLQAIKARAIQLLYKDAANQTITVREIAQFIGTANAAAVAIPPAPLFYRSL